jgi:hypothetical protein
VLPNVTHEAPGCEATGLLSVKPFLPARVEWRVFLIWRVTAASLKVGTGTDFL